MEIWRHLHIQLNVSDLDSDDLLIRAVPESLESYKQPSIKCWVFSWLSIYIVTEPPWYNNSVSPQMLPICQYKLTT